MAPSTLYVCELLHICLYRRVVGGLMHLEFSLSVGGYDKKQHIMKMDSTGWEN